MKVDSIGPDAKLHMGTAMVILSAAIVIFLIVLVPLYLCLRKLNSQKEKKVKKDKKKERKEKHDDDIYSDEEDDKPLNDSRTVEIVNVEDKEKGINVKSLDTSNISKTSK